MTRARLSLDSLDLLWGSTGRIHYTRWTDNEGQTRYGCEIVAEQVDFLAKAKEATKDEPKKRPAK